MNEQIFRFNPCTNKATGTVGMADDWIFEDKFPFLDSELTTLDLGALPPYREEESMKFEDIFQTELGGLTDEPTLASFNLDKFGPNDLDEYLGQYTINKSTDESDFPIASTSYSMPSLSSNSGESLADNPSLNPLSSNVSIKSTSQRPHVLRSKSFFTKPEPSTNVADKETKYLGSNDPIFNQTPHLLSVDFKQDETLEASLGASSNPESSLVDDPSPRFRSSSISTDYSFSSHDEGFASQLDDSEDDQDASSDDESFYREYSTQDLLGAATSEDTENKWSLDVGKTRKRGGQQRYFWQYNVQSKGPKGTRIVCLQDVYNDPHVLAEAKDPVFSPDFHVEGVKHAGKARRGDGNDLTPSPRKLLMIGLELKKLTKVINELTPVAHVPATSRNKTRKEKNKLASRACRLKKKAQHEANKIKLYGLQQEHKRLMDVLTGVKSMATEVVERGKEIYNKPLVDVFSQIVNTQGVRIKVAGKTSEFVNLVLDNVTKGLSDGGLDKL